VEVAEALAVLPPGLGRLGGEPEPLTGGITNRNFRVRLGEHAYVLRLPEPGLGLLGIDRPTECAHTRWAGEAGIGPRLVFAGEGCLLTEWVEAPPLEPGAVPGAAVRAVARALRVIHAGPAVDHVFDPIALAGQQARAAGAALPPEAEAALAAARDVVAELARAPGHEPRPCHNDLLGGNLLWDGARLCVLDWDYAGTNDPWFDLANFAVNNALAPAQEELLLKAYLGGAPGDRLRELRAMQIVSDLREAMWGVAQTTLSRLDFDYAAYAADHFARLERTRRELASAPAR
jgi:aminoglycoside phosphotransferase (APT) family kinase protein